MPSSHFCQMCRQHVTYCCYTTTIVLALPLVFNTSNSSQNAGMSSWLISLRSAPAFVSVTRRASPPEEPSRDMASAKAVFTISSASFLLMPSLQAQATFERALCTSKSGLHGAGAQMYHMPQGCIITVYQRSLQGLINVGKGSMQRNLRC